MKNILKYRLPAPHLFHVAGYVVLMAFLSVSQVAATTYIITQSDWQGGGIMTGKFTGEDSNHDGYINVQSGEVSDYQVTFSGNGLIPGFTHDLSDLVYFRYTVGSSGFRPSFPLYSTDGTYFYDADDYTIGRNDLTVQIGAFQDGVARDAIVVPVSESSPLTILCPQPLFLECSNGWAVGTLQAVAADTNGNNQLSVVWMVDGVSYQTNTIPPGGSATADIVEFTANFASGEHTVVVSASNGQTTSVSCSATVTVRDTTPPNVLAISASPNLIWTPNHQMVPVGVSVSAIDNCDPSPTAKITQITCNEPQGHFAPDWEITGPLSVNLRAERLSDSGRVYTIYVDVTDQSGNKTTVTTTVTVPKSQSTSH